MKLTIRNIKNTTLEEKALKKVIQKYGKTLKHRVNIIFDSRISTYGYYSFDSKKKTHIIQINPIGLECRCPHCSVHEKHKRLDPESDKYLLISTIIHELRHASQKEKHKEKYNNISYTNQKDIKTPSMAEFYSKQEIDARQFELKHILSAIKYYNSLLSCKKK